MLNDPLEKKLTYVVSQQTKYLEHNSKHKIVQNRSIYESTYIERLRIQNCVLSLFQNCVRSLMHIMSNISSSTTSLQSTSIPLALGPFNQKEHFVK